MKATKSKKVGRAKLVHKSVSKVHVPRKSSVVHHQLTGCSPGTHTLLTIPITPNAPATPPSSPSGGIEHRDAAEKALERMRILVWRLEELNKITTVAIDGLQPMLRNLRHESFPHFSQPYV